MLSSDPQVAKRLLELAPHVPFFVWGRDELRAGDMWNSNSQIAWLIARTGLDVDSIKPPPGGRAPGWHAGLAAAARHFTWRSGTPSAIAAGAVHPTEALIAHRRHLRNEAASHPTARDLLRHPSKAAR